MPVVSKIEGYFPDLSITLFHRILDAHEKFVESRRNVRVLLEQP